MAFNFTIINGKIVGSSTSGEIGDIVVGTATSISELETLYPASTQTENAIAFIVDNSNEIRSIAFVNTDGTKAWRDINEFRDLKVSELETLIQNLKSGIKFINTFNPKTNTPPVPLTPLNADYDSGDFYEITGLDDGEEYTWNSFVLTNNDWIIVAKVDDNTLEWQKVNIHKLAKEIHYNNTVSGLVANNVQDAIDEVVVDLDNETTSRQNADITLQGNIDLKYDKTGGTIDGNVNITTGNQYKINNVNLKDVEEVLNNKTINLEDNNLTQATITPLDEAFINGDKQEVLNNKTQGQIGTLKTNNPTQLNPNVRYVSKQGDDNLNGQVDRKKQTIAGAITSLVGQASGIVNVEAGNYNTDLTLGTANSRIHIIGEEGSQRTVLKSITFNENNQQCELTNLKLENTDNAPAINVNSTLSNYVFRNITCGGNHVSNIFLNIASGGSGYISLVGFDISNKIINFQNTTTPRLAFISQSVNTSINVGTGWTVIVDNNSTNILELSSNNNVLRGLIANAIIANDAEYNGIVAGGSATDGYYLVNYTKAGVFATGDIILKQNPSVVVVNKHYNTPNASYYLLSTQQTAHKSSGTWKITASVSDIATITASNGLQKVGNNIQGIDATTSAKGVVQLSNSYTSTSETLATTPKAIKDGLETIVANNDLFIPSTGGVYEATIRNNDTANRLYVMPDAAGIIQTDTSLLLPFAAKANINSPALIGTPTAPTAPVNTNTTQIASTAFVNTQISTTVVTSTETTTTDNDLIVFSGTSGKVVKKATASTFKTLLSLENVDNTSDANKPVSTATQTALNLKQNVIVAVANEAAMLALTGIPVGYVVKRTDLSNVLFQLVALPASTLGNWQQIGGGGSGGGGAWGDITGTLSNQTDLQNALGTKQNTITGAALTAVGSTFGNNNVVITSPTGFLDYSNITTTELGRLVGVTGIIQDQLNSKANQSTTYTKTEADTLLNAKQATLVSGTNIKSINGSSILGSGDITISGVASVKTVFNYSSVPTTYANFVLGGVNFLIGQPSGSTGNGIFVYTKNPQFGQELKCYNVGQGAFFYSGAWNTNYTANNMQNAIGYSQVGIFYQTALTAGTWNFQLIVEDNSANPAEAIGRQFRISSISNINTNTSGVVTVALLGG